MINLIPPIAKKALIKEYWVRVFSVWMILWAFALIAGASLILPTYVLISGQVGVYEESALEASRKVANFQTASNRLVDASQQASAVVEIDRQVRMSTLVNTFRELEGSSIELSGITLARRNDEIAPVLLTGVATDRQALASFRDRLLEQPSITEVDLPISNLARDRDIAFSLTVTMTKDTDL